MVSIDIASTEYAYTKKMPPPTVCHRLWVADLRYGVIEFPYSEDANFHEYVIGILFISLSVCTLLYRFMQMRQLHLWRAVRLASGGIP